MNTAENTIPQDLQSVTLVSRLVKFSEDWQSLAYDITAGRTPSPDIQLAQANFVKGYNLLTEAVAALVAALVAADIRLNRLA